MTDPERAGARIEAALRDLGAEQRPRPGWEARVLAACQPARRRWWSGRAAAFTGALAAAAVLVIVVVWRPWHGVAAGPELVVAVEARGGVARGERVRVGDVVRAAARHGARHRGIWIYRGSDELLVVCPGGPGCIEGAGALAAALAVELVGTYTVIALWSARPIAAPAGTRDEALAAAARGGATRRMESIVVN